jgi:RNA polymerase sigma-70 factor (ECF subfamily)
MTSGAAQTAGVFRAAMRREGRTDEKELPGLMARYQAGESDAVEELVRRLSPLLWNYFTAPRMSRSDIEDLLQDCWIRIHRARHSYRPAEPLLPWVFAIARYTRLDGYRSRRRRESRETLVATPPEIAVDDQRAADRSPLPAAQLTGLLERLPDSQREVILLLKVSGMTLQEVARATSSTAGAIKQKAHRAYARLREMIQKEGK